MTTQSEADKRPLRMRAQLALASKCALTVQQHREAWRRVETAIEDAAKKTDKVFEVHHRIEHAREKYFAALVDGASPDDCESAARRA